MDLNKHSANAAVGYTAGNAPKKKTKWIYILLGLIVLATGIGLMFWLNDDSEQRPATSATPDTIVVEEVKAAPIPDTTATLVANPIPYRTDESYRLYLFTFGSFALSAPTEELNKLVKVMHTNEAMKIQVFAYADNVGSVKFNQTLSAKRAKAICNYLVLQGIASSRILWKGSGISTQYADQSENRRAEFILAK
jgi:OOP family OmpA-OmpF porin